MLWTLAQIAALLWLVGPILGVMLLLIPVVGLFNELVISNIHVLLAASLVVSFRAPAVWPFMVLTKVTPVIGLVWFAVRREWRSLAVALATTGIVVIVSFALGPNAWVEWTRWIASNPPVPTDPDQLLAWASLLVRLPAGLLLIAVAARRDWRWLVPIAIWLSLPVIWYNSPILMAASIPLARSDLQRARARKRAQLSGKPSIPLGRSD